MSDTPYLNPNIISGKIDNDYRYIVNPLREDSVKVIKNAQWEFLESFDGTKNIAEIAELNGVSSDDLSSFISIFDKKDYVNLSGSFTPEPEPEDTSALNLWVHTTDRCTLRCSYCYINGRDTFNQMEEPVIRQMEKKLLEAADNRNLKSVYIRLSGGEAMLRYPVWKESIKRMKDEFSKRGKDCEFYAGFLSNGTAVTDEMISFFKEYDIPVGISLDGFGDYHDKNRIFPDGSGSFHVTMANLEKLLDAGIRVNILTVVSNENMEGLPDFSDWLVEKNLPFRFSFVTGTPLDYKRLNPILDECYRRFEGHIQNGYEFTKLHTLCDLKFNYPAHWTCSSGFSTGTLHLNGDLYFCQIHLGSEKILGNIFDDADLIDMIRNGKKYKGPAILPDVCEECNYRYVCSGGCPLYRENGISPACETYSRFIPEIYRLMALERLRTIKEKQQG